MAPQRIKRQPDPAVEGAVLSILKNQKFKRMMMFGIRSLSELCTPPTMKYKENSLAGIDQGVLPALVTAVSLYGDDDELLSGVGKILWGIAEGMRDEASDYSDVFVKSGGVDTLVNILNASATDETTLCTVLDVVNTLTKCGIQISPTAVASGTIHALDNKKINSKVANRVMSALLAVSATAEGANVMADKQAHVKVLQYCVNNKTSTDGETLRAIESGLGVVKCVAEAGKCAADNLDSIVEILDACKSRKPIVEKGSACMAAMMGPERLQQCLTALSSKKATPEELQNALTLLSSMSYVSSYADEVLKAGGVPMLCTAIKESAKQVSSGDAKALRGLIGGCKMLGKIAQNAANTEAIAKAGGVEALVGALKLCKDHPTGAAACMGAMAPLAAAENMAKEMLTTEGFKTILSMLRNSKNVELHQAGVGVLAIGSHPDLVEAINAEKAVSVVCAMCQSLPKDVRYQTDCVICLGRLALGIPNSKEMTENGGVKAAVALLTNYSSDVTASAAGVRLLEKLALLPDAVSVLSDGTVADAILQAMLVHDQNIEISDNGRRALEVIATEDDVKKCLNEVSTVRNNPQKSLRCLAAVNGLSQIARLRPIFEAKDASPTLLKAVAGWVETSRFNEQQRVVSAGIQAVENLQMNSNHSVFKTVSEFLNMSCLPGLKTIADKQDATNNSLLDLLKSAETLCKTGRWDSPEEVSQVIELVIKVSKKYQDQRKAGVLCLNILTQLASPFGGEGARMAVQQGACKAAIVYMQKVVMYEDVQIAGFRMLNAFLAVDPELADVMKRSGAIECITVASRTHPRSKEVRKYLAPVAAALLPADELERQIAQNARLIEKGAEASDIMIVTDGLRNLTQLTLSMEGSKCAGKANVGQALQLVTVMTTRKRKRPDETCEACAEASAVYRNVAQSRIGATHLTKSKGVESLIQLFETLNSATNCEQKRDGLEANLQAIRALMRHDRENGRIAYNKGLLEKVLVMTSQNPDDIGLMGCAASVLAAMHVKEIAKSPEFNEFTAKLINLINVSADRDHKLKCVEALEEMLRDPDDAIISVLVKNKGIEALVKVVDDYADDPDLFKSAQRCLDTISHHKNLREHFMKSGGSEQLVNVVGVTKRAIRQNKNDPDVCCLALNLLNRSTNKTDRGALQNSGIMDELQEMLQLHPDHKGLVTACGELLANLGADDHISSLMKQIVDISAKKPEGYQKQIEGLCKKLQVYLAGNVEDKDKAMTHAQKCLDALAELMSKHPENTLLLTSICAVSRRIAEMFWDDDNSVYGARALASKMMPTMAEMLVNQANNPKRNKRQICDGFRVMAGVCANPHSQPKVVAATGKTPILPAAYDLLKIYESDPDVVARISEFLANFANSKDGAQQLVGTYPTRKRNISPGDAMVDDIMDLMKRHRNSPMVCVAGMALFGNLIANAGKKCPEKLSDPALLKEIEALGDSSPENLVGVMDLQKRRIESGQTDDAIMSLRRGLDCYKRLEMDDSISPAQKGAVAASLAAMALACAEAGLMDEVKKAGVVDEMIAMIEAPGYSSEVVVATTRSLQKMADMDPDVAAKVSRLGAKVLLGEASHLLTSDAAIALAALSLLGAAAAHEGEGRIIANTNGFKETMEGIAMLAATLPPQQCEEMKASLAAVKKIIEDDNPVVLTLKEVHRRWSARKAGGESLNLAEATVVLQQLDFVADYTEEYSKEQHKNAKTELGSEFVYGCRCFALLHELPENSDACVEKDEQIFMLKAIAKQKDDLVAQEAVIASAAGCNHPASANIWAGVEGAAKISADCMMKGRKFGKTNEEREELLFPRMLLMERLAINRMYFNGTDCMAALIGCWDDFDAGKYTVELLAQVFRSMRKIVNDHWVNIILKNNVPKRLIEVVEAKQAELRLLPDVLFLLGTLAVVPEIKTMIGELDGVEACLDLLKRCLKNPEDTSRVQTNACLALANIILGHGPNVARFVKAKGVELNVEIMEKSMGKRVDYDIANGASVLMCNTCFKRDDMKEIYGKKGGPTAVMLTINKYDGSEDVKGFRCLGSMFKAIANLALFTPNVQVFLQHGVEQTFVHFFQRCEKMPDQLLEIALRTVSNLVMENTEHFMTQFGKMLEPVLKMLQQSQRSSIPMFCLALDVLGCLCRLPLNATNFVRLDGIPTVLNILNSNCDNLLYQNGIHVLGVQTTNPETVRVLIKRGVFTFLVSLLESQAASDEVAVELTVSGLRCIRRLIQTKQNADSFCDAGGVKAISQVLSRGEVHGMVHMDAHRVIIALLVRNPPPVPPPPTPRQARNEWDDGVPDEGVLPAVCYLTRPPSPRSWESIGLDVDQINGLVVAISTTLNREDCAKQLRLVRCAVGLLAYFACEKVDGTVDAFFQGQFGVMLERLFKEYAGDPEIVKTGCFLINNVAYASEPELYMQLRRERGMRKNLEIAVKGLSRLKEVRDFCHLTSKLLNERSADPMRFQVHMQWDYPLELTLWDQDKYPNGVQDLPLEMREEIREGGKFKVILNEKSREILWWKASADMAMIMWRIDPKEGPFPYAVPVSRLRAIGKGFTTAVLQNAHDNGSGVLKIRSGDVMGVLGPAIEGYPEGVELNIHCGTSRSRDGFFDLLCEWRDAATFGL